MREVCNMANLGLLWRTESSIGGSIVVVVEVVFNGLELRQGCMFC